MCLLHRDHVDWMKTASPSKAPPVVQRMLGLADTLKLKESAHQVPLTPKHVYWKAASFWTRFLVLSPGCGL